jgi:hypothetical protein
MGINSTADSRPRSVSRCCGAPGVIEATKNVGAGEESRTENEQDDAESCRLSESTIEMLEPISDSLLLKMALCEHYVLCTFIYSERCT